MSLEDVTIAGQLVSCVDVNAVITHGRRTVTEGPAASSAAVTIYRLESEGMPTWAAGDPIRVTAHAGRSRFTGTITDLDIVGHRPTDQGRAAVFTVQASGNVATLGHRDVGQAPWPVEDVAARAWRILAASGVIAQVEGDPDLRVNPLDVDRQTALDLITALAVDAGAAVFDTPTGTVVFQHYSARAQTWAFRRWMEAPGVWFEQDGWFTDWNSTATASPQAPAPIDLNMCAIGWEPVWRSTSGAVVNDVALYYGPNPTDTNPRPVYRLNRPASVTRFGRRHYGAETQLADEQSAAVRAGMILDLHADPRWSLDNVTLFLNDLPPADLATALTLLCGARVQLTNLPQPAPAASPVRVVEGWTHTLTRTRSDLTFYVSDPLHSYAGIVWDAMDPDGRWMDVPPALAWYDALTDPATP